MKPLWRCSSLDRNLLCNGAQTLVDRVAPRQGAEGDEGTALHFLSHSRMREELGAVGDLGPTPVMPKSIVFSAWIIGFYVDFVRDTVPAGWSLEVEVPLAYEFARFTLSGHIDCFALSPDGTEAIGFDLKTGYDPVDAADSNEQVFGYGCLLLRAYPELRKVTFYVIQPRNDEDAGYRRISEPMVLEGDLLAASLASLEARINAALDNSMEVNSGLKQCKWCPAAMICPATIADRELMKAKLTPQFLDSIKATPDDAVLADWVLTSRVLSRPIEDAETLAKERIAALGSITARNGCVLTIKTRPGHYEVPDMVAFDAALRTLMPDDARILKCYKPSMTTVKNEIAEASGLPKTSKKGESAASLFDEKLRPLTVQGETKIIQFTQ